jgi:hypothetical protein
MINNHLEKNGERPGNAISSGVSMFSFALENGNVDEA